MTEIHSLVNPDVIPFNYNHSKQSVFSIKHITFKQRVGGSIPPGLTKQTKIPVYIFQYCRDF